MLAHCESAGLQLTQVRFMIEGELLEPEDTAELLGLENGDVIDFATTASDPPTAADERPHKQMRISSE